MNKQMSISDLTDELAQVRTHKKDFLEQIEELIPWGEWEAIVKPHYYKGERGNKPYELNLMLHLHILQNLYDLSDMATAAEVIDSRAFSEFCGVGSSNQVPDGDTIGRFRNLLVKNGLQQQFFAQVVKMLLDKGLILKKGTIVDSTIITAPSSTNNQKKARDPEAASTKKGTNWHFGYKAHIGVDIDTGLVHHVVATSANEHDVTVVPELMTGEEEVMQGDSAYVGAEKREGAIVRNKQGKKIRYKMNRKPRQYKNKSPRSQAQIKRYERAKSSVRAKVEHVFGVVKRLFKYRKTRYRGLQKQTEKLNMMFALANLYLADKHGLLA